MLKNRWTLASIFLAIQIIAIFRNYYSDYIFFFWFCDFIPLLFAFAFLAKNTHLVKGAINIGLFAQLIFLIIFFYKLVFGVFILPLAPESTGIFYDMSAIMIHFSTILAFFITYKTKPTKKTLLYSFIILIGIYLAALIFTEPSDGINYVYQANTLLPFAIPYHIYLWIPVAFIFVVLPTQLFQYLVYRVFSKDKK